MQLRIHLFDNPNTASSHLMLIVAGSSLQLAYWTRAYNRQLSV